MWEIILHTFLHVLKHTAMTIPILYLVYLLVCYIGHNSNNKYAKLMSKTQKLGPLIGAVTGCIPQCGFSVVMSDLYSKRAITIGTLIAVMLATSDEAIPLMLSHPEHIVDMLILIGIKLGIAIIFGYLFDFVFKLCGDNQKVDVHAFEKIHNHDCELTDCSLKHVIHDCHHEHNEEHENNEEQEEHEHNEEYNKEHEYENKTEDKLEKEEEKETSIITSNCKVEEKIEQKTVKVKDKKHKKEHKHSSCHCCHGDCVDNIFLDALIHTAKIVAFLFVISFVIDLIIHFAGEDSLKYVFTTNKYVQPFIAALVGLIPSCASSVFLVEFYFAGGITFGAMLAGLCAGSGLGILVLFTHNKKHLLTNILVLISLYLIGSLVGVVCTLII